MKKIKIYCNWDLKIDLYHEKQIELYVDSIPKDKKPKDLIRFVFLLEPPEISNILYGKLNNTIHQYQDNFDYVFTHNNSVLERLLNKSFLFEYGTTWINNFNLETGKIFEISTLVGGKNMVDGHKLRHKVWVSQNEIKTPTKFFLSGNFGGIGNYNNNPVLGVDKKPLFNSQFHVCIENVKRDNWFTEKLIDCLQTKTVPIYYGCPNIGNWFDTRGFFIVNNLDDIINVCNNLDDKTYNNMMPYIEFNFEESKKYTNIAERLKNKILEIV